MQEKQNVCALCVFRATIVRKVLKGSLQQKLTTSKKHLTSDIRHPSDSKRVQSWTENHEEMVKNIKTCQLYEQKLPKCTIKY